MSHFGAVRVDEPRARERRRSLSRWCLREAQPFDGGQDAADMVRPGSCFSCSSVVKGQNPRQASSRKALDASPIYAYSIGPQPDSTAPASRADVGRRSTSVRARHPQGGSSRARTPPAHSLSRLSRQGGGWAPSCDRQAAGWRTSPRCRAPSPGRRGLRFRTAPGVTSVPAIQSGRARTPPNDALKRSPLLPG